MDDFLGSIAQEDVEFSTKIVTTTTPGGNYKRLMIYVENTRFVKDATAFTAVKRAGTEVAKIAEVTAATYTDVLQGNITTWLANYYASGTNESVYVVTVCDKLDNATDFDVTKLDDAFNATHQLAYFKTVYITADDVTSGTLLPAAAVELCKLCSTDALLSSAPLLPCYAGLEDTLYTTVKAAGYDAFFSFKYVDTTSDTAVLVNPALVTLGIAMSVTNSSGVYAGNAFDFVGNDVIKASGQDDESLSISVQRSLKNAHIQYWKYVGDETGNTAAYGPYTINGKHMSAYWLVAYCNYMCKVQVATYMVGRNVRVTSDTYNAILAMMDNTIMAFQNAGVISSYQDTAPAFANRPNSASDEIIINNAWSAVFLDKLRAVSVTGSLTI